MVKYKYYFCLVKMIFHINAKINFFLGSVTGPNSRLVSPLIPHYPQSLSMIIQSIIQPTSHYCILTLHYVWPDILKWPTIEAPQKVNQCNCKHMVVICIQLYWCILHSVKLVWICQFKKIEYEIIGVTDKVSN